MNNTLTPYQAYKFCPKCGNSLKHIQNNLMKCQNSECKYNYYINMAPTVGIIFENTEGKVMLTKRAIEPALGTWDIPGGFMEPGETVEDNAIREAEEELHVKIKPGLMISTFPTTYRFGGIDLPILGITICASILEGTPTPDDDVAEIQYFSKEELKDLNIMNDAVRNSFLNYFKLRETTSLNTLLQT